MNGISYGNVRGYWGMRTESWKYMLPTRWVAGGDYTGWLGRLCF